MAIAFATPALMPELNRSRRIPSTRWNKRPKKENKKDAKRTLAESAQAKAKAKGKARAKGKVLGNAEVAATGRRSKGPVRSTRRPGQTVEALAYDPRAPKPFVKWAGGKRQLLPQILDRLPPKFGRYHEPFVGGGAVFFAIAAGKTAYLSDSNDRLVRSYRGIKEKPEAVIALLDRYPKSRKFFLEMRAQDIDQKDDAEVAAWFIYLNKLAFNGLYRVNSKNKFNVPYGDNENAVICDRENIRACSRALAHATIEREDFLGVGGRAEPGDLVYFDPPYFPVSSTSYFTSYTARGFTRADQEKLRDLAMELKARDVHVLLSNSPPAAALYTEGLGFSVTEVLAARAVNSKAAGRGKITELLIR